MTGPRSDPPIPMLTTLRMRLPVWPFHSPLRTRSANLAILSSTAWTSGTTFLPVHQDRRAVRRAQRDVQHGAVLSDVDLARRETSRRCAPAVRDSPASWISSRSVSSVIRFFE